MIVPMVFVMVVVVMTVLPVSLPLIHFYRWMLSCLSMNDVFRFKPNCDGWLYVLFNGLETEPQRLLDVGWLDRPEMKSDVSPRCANLAPLASHHTNQKQRTRLISTTTTMMMMMMMMMTTTTTMTMMMMDSPSPSIRSLKVGLLLLCALLLIQLDPCTSFSVTPEIARAGAVSTTTLSTACPSFTSLRATNDADDVHNEPSLWSIDSDQFLSTSHPGYSLEPDETTMRGGWLAHRAPPPTDDTTDAASPPPCWIEQEVKHRITRYDYTALPIGRAPRILVLYGSLRETSFSRKLSYEFARLLELVGCDVRVYHLKGLPVRDPTLENDLKVQELRALTQWSDGHVWVSPEMHGTTTGAFKNQIDWIPLNTGSVRPTQGRTCLVAQVNGGSQSFNVVNHLRVLARWMRMPCCTNQSSVAKAWKEFDEFGRMKESGFRDRVVDCAEEFAKFTAIMAPLADDMNDRFSERKEEEKEGRLLTQAEKEARKDTAAEAAKAVPTSSS